MFLQKNLQLVLVNQVVNNLSSPAPVMFEHITNNKYISNSEQYILIPYLNLVMNTNSYHGLALLLPKQKQQTQVDNAISCSEEI